jgi:hypothetical protein
LLLLLLQDNAVRSRVGNTNTWNAVSCCKQLLLLLLLPPPQ